MWPRIWATTGRERESGARIINGMKKKKCCKGILLLPVNDMLVSRKYARHRQQSSWYRHSGYYALRGRVQFRQRESTRKAKTADTHIPPSREKTEKKRYANLPYEQSHPCTYLRQRRRNERSLSSSSFSSSPATTQTKSMRQPSRNKQSYLLNLAGWHGTMSTFDANRLCILSTSNLHCHGDSSAVSSLMPRPLSFRLEATQVLNTLFGIFVW